MSESYKKYKELMKIKKMFSEIISKWLQIRDDSEDTFWYEASEEDKYKPKYVMRMIREINDKMPIPMLNEVSAVESRAAGHIDYFDKFSLYCAELFVYGKSPTYWDEK